MLRTRSGATGPDHHPEAGNVVLSVLVLMVLTTLGAALFTTALRDVARAGDSSDDGRARATAELAVHEAFARIDAGQTGEFTGSGSADGTSWRYVARPAGNGTWQVRAEASSGAVSRSLVATIGRDVLFPHTLFADVRLMSDRNTGRVEGRVGTNGSMEVIGPSPGVVQELYRPDGTCSGCTDGVLLDGPRRLDPVTVPAGPTAACPDDGVFTDEVSGGGGITIVCSDPSVPVVFSEEVTVVDPPLVVYVGRSVPLVLDDAVLNRSGRAADVRLFVDGDNPAVPLSTTGADLTALVYAPGRSLVVDDTTISGSLTIGSLEITRTGRLDISSDLTIAPLGEDAWRIIDLRTVPSGR